MANITDYEIGTTYVGMTNLEELAVPLPPPRSTIPGNSQAVDQADGLVKEVGWLVTHWVWDALSQDQYDQLQTFCPDKSALIYIKTLDEDGTFSVYTTVMVWPEPPERRGGAILDLDVLFQVMEVYTP